MLKTNVADSEGDNRPPLEKFAYLISVGRLIAPLRPPLERVDILRKHVIDVPPLFRAIKAGHKVPHFLIIDHVGNRWRRAWSLRWNRDKCRDGCDCGRRYRDRRWSQDRLFRRPLFLLHEIPSRAADNH